MSQTVVQKILARASGKDKVEVGDVLEPQVDLAMSHENGAQVMHQFFEVFNGTGMVPEVWDQEKIAIIFDHRVPAESRKTATNQRKLREFVINQGIVKFHDIRGDDGGICHQILPQYGYVRPGYLVVGTDSHTTSHGALGAVAFGIGATEMAAVWTLGKVLNVEVPPTIKVNVEGEFDRYIQAKDMILYLIGKITSEGANFKVLEYHGETIRNMKTAGRLTICNMSVEAGATSGIVPADEETLSYLKSEAGVTEPQDMIKPDADAQYIDELDIDVEKMTPQVACPHSVDNVKPVSEVEGTKVDQVVIGSCTNGRIDDIRTAADIVRGKKISDKVRMIVFPASARIYIEALHKGYVEDLMAAGAVVMNSGCGACLGVHQGALGDGETAIATTNRNFKGRMGNPNAEIYLSSPATAAASALTGVITDPQKGGY